MGYFTLEGFLDDSWSRKAFELAAHAADEKPRGAVRAQLRFSTSNFGKLEPRSRLDLISSRAV